MLANIIGSILIAIANFLGFVAAFGRPVDVSASNLKFISSWALSLALLAFFLNLLLGKRITSERLRKVFILLIAPLAVFIATWFYAAAQIHI